ncbi:hypothetical protein QR98_0064240 [Sarcoptes scabiei]|uniref:Uncharacterized protein n=1 Tax=Sarcoptes scabiei TaxID=52283 RepID=A0A132AAB3_SARSC|nr:hypothetical protein QR98_0064240 [Sarcoptes scabiei]
MVMMELNQASSSSTSTSMLKECIKSIFLTLRQKSPIRHVLLSSLVDSITNGGAILVTTRNRCLPDDVVRGLCDERKI